MTASAESPDASNRSAAPAGGAAEQPAAADLTSDEVVPAGAGAQEGAGSPASAEAAASAAPPSVEPAVAPLPAPHPPVPAPRPRPAAARAIPTEPMPAVPKAAQSASDQAWGRVDDDGTVLVRQGDIWRVVGQYPDGSADEAIAYYERKFSDLAGEVTLLETRHRRGGAAASELRGAAEALRSRVTDASAVGDLDALVERLDALTAGLSAASEAEAAAARRAVDEAVRERTEIVVAAEALAARDPETVQWKQASAEMTALFERWQAHQQDGPRLPKSIGQQLWRRFRDARGTVDKRRREFYAELDEAHRGAREAKTRLVERAEALASQGEEGIAAYRSLLEDWKRAGRAGKKADDALWARFKAAGDALYGARAEREAADAEASKEKIEGKRALLAEAAPIVDERDLTKARALLTAVQRRWDDIGRVHPREVDRSLDDDLRRIEQSVRTREDTDWKRNNPETKARANDMTRQLHDAIDKLEAEVADAKARGDQKAAAEAADALEARRTWLRAVGGG